MKSTTLLLGIVQLCLAVNAQPDNHSFYITIKGFAAAEPFFSNQAKGGLTINFPYRTTNSSGTTADSIFRSRPIHPFSALKVYIVHLGIDLGDRRQFFGFHFAPVLMGEGETSGNLSVTFSYGRNLFFDLPDHGHRKNKRYVLKPSLNIMSVGYVGVDAGSPTYIGSINNQAQTVTFGGISSGPTYTYTVGRNPPQTYTDSVKQLNLYYHQQEWYLQPKIAFGTSPYSHWYYFEFYASWLLAFSEKASIKFSQVPGNDLGTKSLNDPAITALYEGKQVKTTPYHLNGWSIGFAMGVNLSKYTFMRFRASSSAGR